MGFIQSLSVGGKADKQAIVNLVDPLEIDGCPELNSKPAIAGNGEVVLPRHHNKSRSIVCEILRTKANITLVVWDCNFARINCIFKRYCKT